MAGALMDRVNAGASFGQTVDITLDSEDPNYCCGRHTESFTIDVGDVDTSLISVNAFLAKTKPITPDRKSVV